MLKNLSTNPILNLLSGSILLATSGYEIWSTIEEFTVGAHHGVFIFSIIQLLKTLPEIFHGSRELEVSIKST